MVLIQKLLLLVVSCINSCSTSSQIKLREETSSMDTFFSSRHGLYLKYFGRGGKN